MNSSPSCEKITTLRMSSQPVMRMTVHDRNQNNIPEKLTNTDAESVESIETDASEARPNSEETNKRDVSQLYDEYKLMSDRLTNSFKRMKEERMDLEVKATRLAQENDFIASEIEKKNKLINELKSEFESLNSRLSNEKLESKRKLEFKIKELHSMLDSVISFDSYISNFKDEYKESLKATIQYCKEMKIKMHLMQSQCLNSGQEYLDNIKETVNSYINEITNIKKAINYAHHTFQNEVMNYKCLTAEKTKFESDSEELRKSINIEENCIKNLKDVIQKAISLRSVLENESAECLASQQQTLKEIKTEITDLKILLDDLDSTLQTNEVVLKNLTNEYSSEKSDHEINLSKLDSISTSFEAEVKEFNSLEKEQENIKEEIESIQKEIASSVGLKEEFYKIGEELKNAEKRRDALNDTFVYETSVQTDLAVSITENEKKIIEMTASRDALLQKKEVLSKELADVEIKISLLKQDNNNIDNEVSTKESMLVNLEANNKSLEDLRLQNEEMALKLKSNEEEIECYQRKIHISRDLISFYNEVVENVQMEISCLEDKYSKETEMHENDEIVLLNEYNEFHVVDINDKLDSLKTEINFIKRQKNKLLEEHQADIDEINRLHSMKLKDFYKLVEDQKSYYESVVIQLTSEKESSLNKTAQIKKKVDHKRQTLVNTVPNLIAITKTSLKLFDELVERYSAVWAQKNSTEPATVNIFNVYEDLEEILRLPLYKLSKLKGMPQFDFSTSNPEIYKMILNRGNELFNSILKSKSNKPVEYICGKLQEIVSCLYNTKRRVDSPIHSKLNDTHYSTTTIDE